jgi:hypothetical protein
MNGCWPRNSALCRQSSDGASRSVAVASSLLSLRLHDIQCRSRCSWISPHLQPQVFAPSRQNVAGNRKVKIEILYRDLLRDARNTLRPSEFVFAGTGYLVIAFSPGNVLYLKTQLRQITVPGKDRESRSAFNGLWEVSGATGKFTGLQGAGTLQINRLSESERQWILEGELSKS